MQKWEYKVVSHDRFFPGVRPDGICTEAITDENIVNQLMAWGDQGWELVSVAVADVGTSVGSISHIKLFFKRPQP
jgi:hypothetical protein